MGGWMDASCRKQKQKQALSIIVAYRKQLTTLLLNPMFRLHFTITTIVLVAVPLVLRSPTLYFCCRLLIERHVRSHSDKIKKRFSHTSADIMSKEFSCNV